MEKEADKKPLEYWILDLDKNDGRGYRTVAECATEKYAKNKAAALYKSGENIGRRKFHFRIYRKCGFALALAFVSQSKGSWRMKWVKGNGRPRSEQVQVVTQREARGYD